MRQRFLAHFTERLVFFHLFFPTKFPLNGELITALTSWHEQTHTRWHTPPHRRQSMKAQGALLSGEKMFSTSGFQSRFLFEKYFWRSLNAAVVWHAWKSVRFETERQRHTHTKKPFIGWLKFPWSLEAYVESPLHTVVLHVQIPCLLARNLKYMCVLVKNQTLIHFHQNSQSGYIHYFAIANKKNIIHLSQIFFFYTLHFGKKIWYISQLW